MSGEHIIQDGSIKTPKHKEKTHKMKVDINVLLNKVRADKKKEKFENLIFLSLVSLVVVVGGLIVSL
tara:strand:- start:3119 stop:3319 length:201 start_codon:yes stop_codon:yes gene_type:complete